MRTAYIHLHVPFTNIRAFLVEAGRIIKTGSPRRILNSHIDHVVDLKDATVLPGFHDAHMHLLGKGMTLNQLDASRYASTAGIQRAIRQRGGREVVARGFHEDMLEEGRTPTRADLDAADRDRPVLLYRACGHLIVANTPAIEAAEKRRGGYPEAKETFDVNQGWFSETAREWIAAALPSPDEQTLEAWILDAQDALLSQGVTAVASDDFSVTAADPALVHRVLKQLDADGKLKLFVLEQANLGGIAATERFLNTMQKQPQGRYRLGPIKLFTDGSLGAGTAWMKKPYADMAGRGLSVFNDREIERFFHLAHAHGRDVALHAIGDAAIEAILMAYGRAQRTLQHAHRHAIIHAQLASRNQLARMHTLGIGAQIQPAFVRTDAELARRRLGKRSADAYAFGTMESLGIPLALSTDCPIESSEPLANLDTAVHRLDKNNAPFHPEERMSLKGAIDAYTRGGAYFARTDNWMGQIRKGFDADFVVVEGLDADAPQTLETARVAETYIRGERVWSGWD